MPVALEHSHRIAFGKRPGVVRESFPPGRWAEEVVSLCLWRKKGEQEVKACSEC